MAKKITMNKHSGKTFEEVFAAFVTAKTAKGVSDVTIRNYHQNLHNISLHFDIQTPFDLLTKEMLDEMVVSMRKSGLAHNTIATYVRQLRTFLNWCNGEGLTTVMLPNMKEKETVKETYTDEALETMRDNCDTLRDLALIDMLASTGMRVGELVLLNRDDINFEERECVVFGKGSKERMVYFDARTKIHLQNYLAQRTDSNNALFVSLKAPHERLQIGGVETRLRELGKRLSLPRVHPHKFRRTLATMAIDKGMPVEQLQRLLGHQRIDTTLQYAMVKQSNVKIAHRKYIG